MVCATGDASSLDQHADELASLIDPAKLATLGKRGANPRIQKAVLILAEAESDKLDPGAVCAVAVQRVKMKPAAGELTKAALLCNLDIARKRGCLDAAGLDDMRHGRAPTIRRGPYKGDKLSVVQRHWRPARVGGISSRLLSGRRIISMGVICRSGWVWKRWRIGEKGGECCRFRPRNPRKHSIVTQAFAGSQPQQTQ